MRPTPILALVGAILPLIASADPAAEPGRIQGQLVDQTSGKPIPDVAVLLEPRAAQPVRSDADGRYAFEVPAGTYQVVVALGGRSVVARSVTVEAGATTSASFKLDGALAIETIDIHEPPQHRAEIVEKTAWKMPEYSKEAIDEDTWASAWVQLLVSPAGTVQAMRFLHRPGHGLDELAVKRAFELRFEPAHNASGQAVPDVVVWKMEWPSYNWLVGETWKDTATTGWRRVYFNKQRSNGIPCADAGRPFTGEEHPRYRDCSEPDYSLVATEPLITRVSSETKPPRMSPGTMISSLNVDSRRDLCDWAAALGEDGATCTARLGAMASCARPVSDFVACSLGRAKGKLDDACGRLDTCK